MIPARGQIVLTEPVPRFIHRVLSGAEPSARQTRRGNVIIGSTVEHAGFDKRVTTDTIGEFAHGAVAHFPRLRGPPYHPQLGGTPARVARSQAHHRAHGTSPPASASPPVTADAASAMRRAPAASSPSFSPGREPFLPLDAFSLARFEPAEAGAVPDRRSAMDRR